LLVRVINRTSPGTEPDNHKFTPMSGVPCIEAGGLDAQMMVTSPAPAR
jgi:hypothetical protein